MGGNEASIGFVISCVEFGKFVGNIPSGQYVGLFGSYPGLIGSCVILSVAWLLAATAPSIHMLVIASVIEGTGLALWQIGRLNLITSLFDVDEGRGTMMATIAGFESFASSAGPSIGGYLATTIGLRAPFYAKSILAMLDAGLLCILQWLHLDSSIPLIPRLRKTKWWKQQKQSKQIQQDLFPDETAALETHSSSYDAAESSISAHDSSDTTVIIRNSDNDDNMNGRSANVQDDDTDSSSSFWSIFSSTLKRHAQDLRVTSVWLMLFPIARETRVLLFPLRAMALGYDAGVIGVMTSITYVVHCFLFPVSGYLMDEYGRKTCGIATCLLLALSYMTAPWASNTVTLTLSGTLGGIGCGLSGGVLSCIGSDLASRNNIANSNSNKTSQRECAMFLGIFRAVSDAGNFLGPLVGGLVASRLSLSYAFYTTAMLSVLAAVWMAFVMPETRWQGK